VIDVTKEIAVDGYFRPKTTILSLEFVA